MAVILQTAAPLQAPRKAGSAFASAWEEDSTFAIAYEEGSG